jgi:hypothetical protein
LNDDANRDVSSNLASFYFTFGKQEAIGILNHLLGVSSSSFRWRKEILRVRTNKLEIGNQVLDSIVQAVFEFDVAFGYDFRRQISVVGDQAIRTTRRGGFPRCGSRLSANSPFLLPGSFYA